MKIKSVISGIAFFLVPTMFCSAFAVKPVATNPKYEELSKSSLELVSQLIAAKPESGSESKLVPIIERRLKQLELDYQIVESSDNRPNFLIRLKANPPSAKKALMILAHMDVVTAEGQNWSAHPHTLTIKDGYAQGRGVIDDLGYVAVAVELMGELKKSQTPLDRDIILMLNSDEEKGGTHGVKWLVKNRPDLFENIEYAINEGGGIMTTPDHEPLFMTVSAAEKIYQDYKVVAKGPTGHSSVPPKETAIYQMSEALAKLNKYQFKPRLLEITQSYFRERAKVEPIAELKKAFTKLGAIKNSQDKNDLSKNYSDAVKTIDKYPMVSAQIRTTCVATVINGGVVTGKNALPPEVTAYVNCRVLPDEDMTKHAQLMKSLLEKNPQKADDSQAISIVVTPEREFDSAVPSPLNNPVVAQLQKLATEQFKGIPLIPSMQTGGTDSRFLRGIGIPAYGIGPSMLSDEERKRPHGIDERIYLANHGVAIEFFHRLVLGLAQKQ